MTMHASLERKTGQATNPPLIEDALPVRAIAFDDLLAALRAGWADFQAKPSHILFLGILYPIVAVLLAQASIGASVLPIFFPLLAGFALIGPFAGIGLYEISRRRERGEDPSWQDALAVVRNQSFSSILALGGVLMALLALWLIVALSIYNWLFAGVYPATIGGFLTDVLTTGRGWALIIIGHAIGFVFAVIVLMVSAVSFPLLLDRPIRAAAAIGTSIAAVRTSPVTFAIWGAIIAGSLMVGSALLFAGLAVIVPVLAHASWHLYRRVVI
jgi:uncharacterized membrane protein